MSKPVRTGPRFGLLSLSLLILLLLFICSFAAISAIDTMNKSAALEVEAKATNNALKVIPTAIIMPTSTFVATSVSFSYSYALRRMFPEAFEAMNSSKPSRDCLVLSDLTASFKNQIEGEYRTFVSSDGRLTLHLGRRIGNQFHDEFFNFTETATGCLIVEP